MTAAEFTPTEDATVARIDAAPDAAESQRVRVARALEFDKMARALPAWSPEWYLRLADAALAVRLTPADDTAAAVARVEALAADLENVARDYRHVPSGTHDAGARNAHMTIARRIRAALAQPAAATDKAIPVLDPPKPRNHHPRA